jgi:hypothetical protein
MCYQLSYSILQQMIPNWSLYEAYTFVIAKENGTFWALINQVI